MSTTSKKDQAPIRIGSRGSQLALWQANHILEALRSAGHAAEIEVIRTTGDRMQQPGFVPPADLDGKGIFIKEIEEALAEGRIDLAVHSLKDLPTKLSPRFTLAAIPKRADARDAWVCEPYWGLHTLPMGGRIGTTSPRRKAQILALRPDVHFVDVRGNIDTRLKKLAAGECDALVLAAAGLDRIGRTEWVHQRFSPDELCPAPGQGALAIETRSCSHVLDEARDLYVRQAVTELDDSETRFCVEAERITLDALGGGCSLPIGAHCIPDFGKWRMFAQVIAPDGESMVQIDTEASPSTDAETLGRWVAEDLKSKGALDLLASSIV
ncbi:hydroxymethylbilane synthase [Edaphobacter aggregans]|uniref:hydroxymethylbilane synthase n=1 Tax=Edaphobacter aggregans TaxID=570835 RepID=UPI000557BC7E|nr:hydroxymethylbilane synthase [Edaphobacter aggregans]